MTTPYERLLDEMATTLRGPRRARQRLLDEIAEDFKDGVEAESAAGVAPGAAEALVAARFGNPTAIANRWNNDQALRRRAMQRNTLVLMTAVAMAGALGMTQYASGKSSPTPLPTRCTQARLIAPKIPMSAMVRPRMRERSPFGGRSRAGATFRSKRPHCRESGGGGN